MIGTLPTCGRVFLAVLSTLVLVSCVPSLVINEHDRPFIERIDLFNPVESQLARQQLVNAHPEWPPAIQQAVLAGEIVQGMSHEQVLAAWGMPQDRARPFLMMHSASSKPPYYWLYNRVTPPVKAHFYDIDNEWRFGVATHDSLTGERPPEVPRGQYGYVLKSH